MPTRLLYDTVYVCNTTILLLVRFSGTLSSNISFRIQAVTVRRWLRKCLSRPSKSCIGLPCKLSTSRSKESTITDVRGFRACDMNK